MGFSVPHILLLSAVAVVLLGGGRFSTLMGDVAKGVKQFKKGVADDLDDDADRSAAPFSPTQPRLSVQHVDDLDVPVDA